MTAHPFRFTVQGSRAAPHCRVPRAGPQAEDLGYQGLAIADHFDSSSARSSPSPPPRRSPQPDAGGARALQRLPPSGGGGEGDRDARPAVRRPGQVRARRRVGHRRLRWTGVGARPARHPGRAAGRGARRLRRASPRGEPVSFPGTTTASTACAALPRPSSTRPPPARWRRTPDALSSPPRRPTSWPANVALTGGGIDASVGPDATAEHTDRSSRWIREAAGDRYDGPRLQVLVTSRPSPTTARAWPSSSPKAWASTPRPRSLAVRRGRRLERIVDTVLVRR